MRVLWIVIMLRMFLFCCVFFRCFPVGFVTIVTIIVVSVVDAACDHGTCVYL